jgi:hypothetical protein
VPAPFALLQDVGSDVGTAQGRSPRVEKAPIWSDRADCTTSMDALPYHGATFKPVKISDAGRKHLADCCRSSPTSSCAICSQRAVRSVDGMLGSASRADRGVGAGVQGQVADYRWSVVPAVGRCSAPASIVTPMRLIA